MTCTLYEKCELRCPPLQRLIKEQYGIDISLRMLERFCADIRQEHRLERLQAEVPIRYECQASFKLTPENELTPTNATH